MYPTETVKMHCLEFQGLGCSGMAQALTSLLHEQGGSGHKGQVSIEDEDVPIEFTLVVLVTPVYVQASDEGRAHE